MRLLLCGLAAACVLPGCSAPISTLRSPAHPRSVAIENTTPRELRLEVLPVEDGRLRAPTTFRGALRPGERKILYLYDGFTYRLLCRERNGDGERETRVAVDSDLHFAVASDSIVASAQPDIVVGEARTPGFRDERDRIRQLHGEPGTRLVRSIESSVEGRYVGQPYEIWIYFDTGYRYLFLDEYRSGRYTLLTSSDPQEPGRADWQERFPDEVVEELLRQ